MGGMSLRKAHSRSRAATALAVILAVAPTAFVTTLSAPAFAGGDEAATAGLEKFNEGRKAYVAQDYAAALAAFKASLALLPSPNTRLYIGRCYRALGKVASAHTALKLAAQEAEDRLTASGEKRYTATRDAANQEAAEIAPKVPFLTVAVPANPPPGFVVKINGTPLPQAAWGIATETDPGSVVVEATGRRLRPFKKTVKLAEGAHVRVEIPLTRVPTATLTVKLATLPAGLTLSLDGQPVRVTGALAPRELDPGRHTLVASAPGYLPFKWSRSLADTESKVVVVSLKPNPHEGGGTHGTPKWLFFTVAGASVVTAGVGAYIGLHAKSQQNDQLALGPYARDPAVRSSIRQQAVLTDVMFGASGVLAVGAVVLAFTTRWHKKESRPHVAFAPWVGPGVGGVGAHGSF